jgi:heme/copper-type cytochrome/quinol oxidase subunit 2
MQFHRVYSQTFGLYTTIAEVVFGLVLAMMLVSFVLSWRRRRRGLPPSKRAKHNPLELTYLACLAGIAIFLVTASFSSNSAFFSDPPPALRVRVTAFQWCWHFQYVGTRVSVTGRCAGGPVPTLVLPANRPVEIELTSRDVIHSFWLPGLAFKMDIYPDHVNTFTTTLRPGRWLGRCAEFCGLYHYAMMFHIQAYPVARFDRWLRANGGPAHLVGSP